MKLWSNTKHLFILGLILIMLSAACQLPLSWE